ncbi:MAG: hypothetical protein WDN72_04970 [Alphaproteobacteria bacterium]
MTTQIHRLGKRTTPAPQVFTLGAGDDSRALKVRTFSNIEGGNGVFKALSHPLAARGAEQLIARLAKAGAVAIYDPFGHASDFAAFYAIGAVNVTDVFVQDVKDVGKPILGCIARPVTEMADAIARTVLVACFDSQRPLDQVRHLLPAGVEIATLDEMRLPEEMITNRRNYLDLMNFATNFALFRDAAGEHTRVTTANYWASYGGRNAKLWCCLMAESGEVLAEWTQQLGETQHLVTLDSKEIRARFQLPEFSGSLFMHVIGGAGHDMLKYALDTYGDEASVLSCTHDANSWPADLYAGIPAPARRRARPAVDREFLAARHSRKRHRPRPHGRARTSPTPTRRSRRSLPTRSTSASGCPRYAGRSSWNSTPAAISSRPRYEIISDTGHKRIAHANVERTDLKPDEQLKDLPLMGKGFLLPAPILPLDEFRTVALPTPMATGQVDLPLAVLIFDASGEEVLRHPLGRLKRSDSVALDVGELLQLYGHMA